MSNATLARRLERAIEALQCIVDQARACERCDRGGLEPRHQDDACHVCGGTGEYAIVSQIPDIRYLLSCQL